MTSSTKAPSLVIDWTRCDGHGLCAALLPQAISRDEWGYPVIDQARLARLPAGELNRVIGCCPALALRRG
ncbi:MAG: ferredoxin [Jatrophihabitantaceae bacterium]